MFPLSSLSLLSDLSLSHEIIYRKIPAARSRPYPHSFVFDEKIFGGSRDGRECEFDNATLASHANESPHVGTLIKVFDFNLAKSIARAANYSGLGVSVNAAGIARRASNMLEPKAC